MDSGTLVEVVDGKSTEVLPPFWKRLKHGRAKVEAVVTDMASAYIEAVRENLPEAALVFDHCHIIRLYDEKLTELRRAIAKEAGILEESSLKAPVGS
uniref:Transposase n=1 Tax=Candidatus Kentrum sp. TC TaxID=2126339 RepID=A0A450YVQ7_9GAMM|nr:MAG: Transposase [Candidatus Kentron sp. TC]VFK53324.1 MAG: Transposase [Candidatus Kentron sp. TC]